MDTDSLTLRFARRFALIAMLGPWAMAEETVLKLASTTSTEQSGFFKAVLPLFTADTQIRVHVVAVGTGQALDMGRRGDADVLLVHDRQAEDAFVGAGYGLWRKNVMFNDFVVVGPKAHQSTLAKTGQDAVACLRQIATLPAPFVSRGDKSGTHAAELRLWQEAGITPTPSANYKVAGSGMGPTLNIASGVNGFTLSDRATWAAFKNRGDLAIVCQGDRRLHNPYGVIPINPQKHPHVQQAAAERFASWLTTAPGRRAIAQFQINGEAVFFPLD